MITAGYTNSYNAKAGKLGTLNSFNFTSQCSAAALATVAPTAVPTLAPTPSPTTTPSSAPTVLSTELLPSAVPTAVASLLLNSTLLNGATNGAGPSGNNGRQPVNVGLVAGMAVVLCFALGIAGLGVYKGVNSYRKSLAMDKWQAYQSNSKSDFKDLADHSSFFASPSQFIELSKEAGKYSPDKGGIISSNSNLESGKQNIKRLIQEKAVTKMVPKPSTEAIE